MRVLHLTLSVTPGGRREAILTLADQLRRRGVECGLLALRDTRSETAGLAGKVDYWDGMGFSGRPGILGLAAVRRVSLEHQVDLIHAHDGASQYVASALRLTNPSVGAVMTFHRTLPLESEGIRNQLRNRLSLPLIQRVLTATEERRQFFLSETATPPERVQVIPLGVDLDTFRPDPTQRDLLRAELGLSPDTVLCLAIGHCGPEKGIDQVVSAFARATSRLAGRPWHLALLGGGPTEQLEALHRTAREQLGTRVTLAGFRDDVARWLQGADLLVHAPRLEAFGLVVVQAMASAIPVLATAVGGLPEVVADGVTGRLVPPGDLDRLADELVALIGDEGERLRLGRAGVACARNLFDAKLYAARHFTLYQALLNGNASRAGVTA